jgi:hypothetical protein
MSNIHLTDYLKNNINEISNFIINGFIIIDHTKYIILNRGIVIEESKQYVYNGDLEDYFSIFGISEKDIKDILLNKIIKL